MKDLAALVEVVRDCYHRGIDFLLSQVSDTPGWGTDPSENSDPWTTSQVLFSIASQRSIPSWLTQRTVSWLEDVQNVDGSWGSIAYGRQGDTPATAWATIALLQCAGHGSMAAQKGLKWLSSHFCQGWTTLPATDRQPFQVCHFYSTAQALRALVRGKRHNLNSMCIQEGLTLLRRGHEKEKGWGFQPDSPSDPTFTAYVLHALHDIRSIWGIKVSSSLIDESTEWLISVQNENGSWSEWHGLENSPEAAGYVIFCLLCSGVKTAFESVTKAVEWLIEVQNVDGGWQFDPTTDECSNNWVTHTALLGLKAFWLSYADKAARPDSKGSSEVRASRAPLPSAIEMSEVPIDFFDALQSIRQPDKTIPSLPIGSKPSVDLGNLYSLQIRSEWIRLPSSRPLDHTMYKALDKYVGDKLPVQDIEKVINRSGLIEVYGVYPEHFESLARYIGFSRFERLDYVQKPTEKKLNYVRPAFYRVSRAETPEIIGVSVVPGCDYVFHYATMIRHFVLNLTKDAQKRIAIFRYPLAEKRIASWSGLESNLVTKGDRVVIGYVSFADEVFRNRKDFEYLGSVITDFYESSRFRLPDGTVVNLLGVKFCFWGSISEVLAMQLCSLGCAEIIYVGKLGALSKPEDVYFRIFCPSHFVLLHHDQVVYKVAPPQNHLLRTFPALDSGCHVSVPTVLEEDYVQSQVARGLRAQSVDNEIAQIAHGVTLYNAQSTQPVSFTAIHFATDYIRQPDERDLQTDFDLGNDKTEDARLRKATMVQGIIERYLIPYFIGS